MVKSDGTAIRLRKGHFILRPLFMDFKMNERVHFAQMQMPPGVLQIFNSFDKNRSGYLDYKEIRRVLKHQGIELTSIKAQQLVGKYDENPDGKNRAHGSICRCGFLVKTI